jgi:hypothetical protein
MRFLLAFVALAAAGCGTCTMPSTAARIAGPDAVDCGEVADGADPAAAWGCAVDAFDAGQPFFVVFDGHGIDSVLISAMVSDGDRVWTLLQDQVQGPRARIDGWDCVDPVDGTSDAGFPIVSCTSTAPSGNHMAVCGSCGGCNPQALPFDG